MDLPFTTEEFFEVFRTYNRAIGPTPWVAYGLGIAAVGLAAGAPRGASRWIALILAAFWAWIGGVYHLQYFRPINPLALVFGAAFLVQALVFLTASIGRTPLRMAVRPTADGVIGALLILYATVGYPILSIGLGHTYPAAPLFGVAPCPTTIFTLGLLLWTRGPVPVSLWAIPVGWALIGSTAAWKLGVWQDLGLLAAGGLAVPRFLRRTWNARLRNRLD